METETTKTEPPSNENSSPEDITVSQESPQPVIEEKVVEETKVEDVDLTKEDTFVWAKLAGRQPNKIRGWFKSFLGYPFWPGQVVNPSGTGLSAKKGSVIVKFYGTNDYAPVKIDLLKDWLLKYLMSHKIMTEASSKFYRKNFYDFNNLSQALWWVKRSTSW